jgi:hypothetical protein
MIVLRLKSWGKRYGVGLLGLLGLLLVAHLFRQLRPDGDLSWLEAIGIAALVILGLLLVVLLVVFFGIRIEEPFFSYGNESYSVEVDFSSPLNRGVLEYLKRSRPKRKAEWESVSPVRVKNPILGTNTHPDTGVRLWSDLTVSLPVECRWIVLGTPALVHPETGILFGVAIGTEYVLRLTDADMETALKAGASTERRWSDGSTLDLVSEFGPGWIFGSWQLAELGWCRAAYEALGTAKREKAPGEGA